MVSIYSTNLTQPLNPFLSHNSGRFVQCCYRASAIDLRCDRHTWNKIPAFDNPAGIIIDKVKVDSYQPIGGLVIIDSVAEIEQGTVE